MTATGGLIDLQQPDIKYFQRVAATFCIRTSSYSSETALVNTLKFLQISLRVKAMNNYPADIWMEI